MIARSRKPFLFTIAIPFVACIPGCFLIRQYRARAAQRDLAALVPQIASITVYDTNYTEEDESALATAISAPFPVEVFTRAASSAQHRSGLTIWIGSSLAVLTLRDGSQRRAHFSYYGGFFKLNGASGVFTIPGGESSDFHQRFYGVVQEEFIPQRREWNKKQNASRVSGRPLTKQSSQ